MEDGMMRMRQVQSLNINANSQVVLAPHGLHLMIFSLKKTINTSDVAPLTLYFSNDINITLQLPVASYNR
jgi:copper(I)-binding protein